MNRNKETDVEMVNIISIQFKSTHSAIIANLKTSWNKVVMTVPYKIDMGSNGNIMPFYMYKKIISYDNKGAVSCKKRYKNQTKNT